MFKNKKGVSDIVVTVMIIVIALAAVGVVWFVVNNIIKGNLGSADLQAKCLGTDLEVKRVTCKDATTTTPFRCAADIERKSSGSYSGDIAGVVLVYSDATGKKSSPLYADMTPSIPVLGTATVPESDITGLGKPNKVELTVFFKDAGGSRQICPSVESTFSFT